MTARQPLRRTSAPRSRRTVRSGVGDAMLTLLSLGGVICIVGVLLALIFNITLIMFKTGSMSPTIPTGSLAVVREIAAKDVRVGDITTIDRPGALPITHRVTAIAVLAGGSRQITMRGDANTEPDAEPYNVTHVRLVVFSIPRLAYAVVSLSNPLVMGGIAVGVAGLVTWAFWPRAEGSLSGSPKPARSGTVPRHGRRRQSRRWRGSATLCFAVLLIVPLVAMPVGRANALPVNSGGETDTVTHGSTLTLTSVTNPDEADSLSPDRPVYWQVGVESTSVESGIIHIKMTATGPLADNGGLSVTVNSCRARWISGTCGPGPARWLSSRSLASASLVDTGGHARELGTVLSTDPVWLMVTMVLSPGAARGAFANIQIHARGVGDELAITTPTVTMLAATGVSLTSPIILAIVAVLAGLAIAATAARTRIRRFRRPLINSTTGGWGDD